jgi:hypothetical protein
VASAASRVDFREAAVADNAQFIDRITTAGTGSRPMDNALSLEIALLHSIAP